MRKILFTLLALGVCLGAQAGEPTCKEKKKIEKTRMHELKKNKKENRHNSKQQEKAILRKMKSDEKSWKKKNKKCECAKFFQTQPADKLLAADHKVKRDSSGNRV